MPQQQQDHLQQQQQQQHQEYEGEEESSSSIPNSPTFSPSQKSYPFIPKKSKKAESKDNPISPLDLISPLPDPILSHILSFLPSEDALSTSSLSKRWLHLWATLPCLSFRSNLHWNNGLQPFISLLNGVLRRYGPCNLISFHLHFDFSTAFADRLCVWLRFVTNRNVEHIELNLYGDQDLHPLEVEHYKLPQYLFDYVNLRVLRVRFCEVAPSGDITWGTLRVLSIGYARLSDELVRRILGGSPVLEDVELYKCGRISCLDLRGCLSLKRLVVYDYWDSSDFVDGEVLEIFGGGLRSLGLLGFLYRKKVKVRDVSRLVDVEIDFELMTEVDGVEDHNDYEEYRGMLLGILENVHTVEELTVGTWCLELLSICELKGFHSPLLKCKHLILNTCISAWDLPGVANLLRASPDVEKFVINMRCSFTNEFAYSMNFITTNSFDEKSYWTAKEEESKSWLLKLRTIKIVGFIADGGETNLVLLLVQFLLKKAQALERVIIDIHNRHPNRWWRHSKLEDILKIEKFIESFPRSSPHVKITLRHMSDS